MPFSYKDSQIGPNPCQEPGPHFQGCRLWKFACSCRQESGVSRSLQIFFASKSLISLCLGTVEVFLGKLTIGFKYQLHGLFQIISHLF